MRFVILEQQTISEEFGWVFFYQSQKYVETGEFRHKLAGNAPFIIDRETGSLHVTGTARPTEFYINNYKKYGTCHAPE